MAGLTYAQKQAFAQIVVQFVKDNEAQLKEAGLDAAKKVGELEAAVKQAVDDDVKQEQLKSELVRLTGKAVASLNSAYTQASSLIDAMVGVVGKGYTAGETVKTTQGPDVKRSTGRKERDAVIRKWTIWASPASIFPCPKGIWARPNRIWTCPGRFWTRKNAS